MIKQKIIPLVLCMLTCRVSFGATEVQRYQLDYFHITPFYADKSRSVKVFAKLSSNGPVTRKLVNFYLYNSKYKTGTMIKNLRPSDESGLISATSTGTLMRSGEQNRIKIFFSDGDGQTTTHWFDMIEANNPPRLVVDQLQTATYESFNVASYTKSRGYFTSSDKYEFKNWYAINEMNIYNKLDVGMFSFTETICDIPIEIEYYIISIGIPAIYGLFCDLRDDEIAYNRVELSLDFVDVGNHQYQLQFKDKLYVNPYTYEMARSQLPGFVETKYIYLPKNGFSDLRKLDFTILGEKLGTMRIDFSYSFSIEAERSRMGNCVSSEYCIKTNDVEFNDIGKELKHD
ncbi:MAG: hypothetical protein SPL75_00425 [Bacilli bacterium]|nr:hypothetical protein [Bacilli bacterium]MDY6362811.1 hypothetical protein [Bacilli bacterium]